MLKFESLYEKIEFNKIKYIIEEYCVGEIGRNLAHNIQHSADINQISKSLSETNEFRLGILHSDRLYVNDYEEITNDANYLRVEGSVLSIDSLQRIQKILTQVKSFFSYFNSSRNGIYPQLFSIIQALPNDEFLFFLINNIIDENGEIKQDASPELSNIRKSIISKQKELEKIFRQVITTYRNKGWLSDNIESFRNGRRVLSVPSEHKRKIRGIIHDESTTGKTTFIEPEEIIGTNNDIFDLQLEEKKEIFRILRDLSDKLRPFCDTFLRYQEAISYFDLIQAKAKLSVDLKATLPNLVNFPTVNLRNAFHPLLYLKNTHSDQVTVPFDLFLNDANRILIISGPNAGGKSITMKSVILLQVMIQSGILIPVKPSSEVGIFTKFFADIGDQQSLDDDLSTYSSRLKQMKEVLHEADDLSLVVIDEFGSGTDPKIGGAIAEAILDELNNKKVFGVITTHYSNLKIYAFKHDGVLNGSMTYNIEQYKPMFELNVGRPGSSFAFEIASKTGLPAKVLKYAKQRTGKNEKAVDELLIDLQRERLELQDQLKSLNDKQKKLDQLIKSYENVQKELEFNRKKFKLEKKEYQLQQMERDTRTIDNLVREIKDEQNLERAKQLAEIKKLEKQKEAEQVMSLKDEVFYRDLDLAKKTTLNNGDYVKFRNGGAMGQIIQIQKEVAYLQIGSMKIKANLKDLMPINEPLEIKRTLSVNTDTVRSSAGFDSKLDLRGLRRDEALKVLEDFVDRALLTNANQLRILHGKGDGILKKAVKSKLKEYKGVAQIRHPEEKDGGDGITIVEFS
ncbi:MAG: Smr/MutS family protein [Saprospiraceae bacterium]|nr:Smr/MutS family protein [Saprospiraceae bacterium]